VRGPSDCVDLQQPHVEVEGEHDPIWRAFYRWMGKVTQEVASTVDTKAIERVLAETTIRSGLLDMVEALQASGEASELTQMRERALARGLRERQRLEALAGGFKPTQWVAEHLAMTRQAIDKRRDAGRLLAIRNTDGSYSFPLMQFDEHGVAGGLEDVLTAFAFDDPWLRLAALIEPTPALGGRSIIDVLKSRPPEAELRRVLSVARSQYAA